ncbi:hypothetical protein PPL_10002 [Heterostelium album PN500]|uniref:Cupin type-2 domain-containing protein n=1 Tax=Heterostelium pallidum (strain ATCC 26659 / Pp 5 / PN500) TaxID=670386 RepID=D3BPV8_HETP5|nr:hypothetical protein PPL_10002 [Heterostelium album PN500]EFA76241.1 hypothetical protein PPL_10002 [Heterostelium album PN500]|eukprot:XP_020428374.1 hypothetical protein PPL_10002 [Heterostelium album PN500]
MSSSDNNNLDITGDDKPNWRDNGVKVIKSNQLDSNTAQTPGMHRAAAINAARVGAQKIWAGTVTIHANAKTGAHHHGALESVIFVIRGKARLRWGEKLEYVAEAEPGDFIFVPPYVPHQEINASDNEPLECVLVRSDNEAVVVNLNIEAVEKPENVYWIDPIHKQQHEHDHQHDHQHDHHDHDHDHDHEHSPHEGHHQAHPNQHDMCDNSHAHDNQQ